MNIALRAVATAATVLAVALTAAPPVTAQETVATSEAQNYVGSWALAMDFNGQNVEMTLDIKDVDGKLAATVTSPRAPAPTEVESITKTDAGLVLKYGVEFGGNAMTLVMTVKEEGGTLTGSLGDENGLFNAQLTGAKGGAAPAAAAAGAGGPRRVEPTNFPTENAMDYIGTWDLKTKIQGNDVTFVLQLEDQAGLVAGLVKTNFSQVPTRIEKIEKTDTGLKFAFEMSFGAQSMTLEINAALNNGVLTGKLGDSSGFFNADFTGTPSQETLVAASPEEQQQARRRGGRRGGGAAAQLTLSGNSIRIAYADLSTNGDDYKKFQQLADGTVFEYVGGRAAKLMSDADLVFGDIVVPCENAAKGYPGVYSVWLKKNGGKWSLVFNEEADIWGTMHNPEADKIEVPVEYSESAEAANSFSIKLEEAAGGGVLTIAWGNHKWTANFKLGQKSIKAST